MQNAAERGEVMMTPRLWVPAAVGCALLGLGMAVGGRRLMFERRELVMRAVERELRSSLDGAAQLLAERARDIRTDLEVVVEASRQQAPLTPAAIELVRTNLTALDRATKNYVRLWYVADGRVLADVSGGRATPFPIPDTHPEALAELERRAHARPGEVVTGSLPLLSGQSDRRFRAFALSGQAEGGVVIALADLDAVFETLQGSARLPGAELWVVDSDLGVLVEPAGEGAPHAQILAAIAGGAPEGTQVVGPLPGLAPFTSDGPESRQVAWTSRAIEGMRWTIGVAVPLARATRRIHDLRDRLLGFAAAASVLVVVAGVTVVLVQRRQLVRAEREQHLSTVARLRDQLVRAEKLSMIGQLASGVAHEIGTPLGVIAIRVDQLLARAGREQDAPVLAVVKDEIARINRIIQQLLDFSRPRATLARAVPLSASLGRVRALIEHRYDQKDVDLAFDVDEEAVIQADPDQLEQVLLNLLLNACDACRPRDQVTLTARPSPRGAERIDVEVVDTGSGIAPADLERIFEPFFTTKPPGAGTGLGLTVAREIVEQHGGEILVASSPAGTRIVISWPSASLPEASGGGRVLS